MFNISEDISDPTDVQISPNILWGTRTYLIGNMEYQNGEDWRDKVKRILSPRGVICFDPYHKPFINDVDEDTEARSRLQDWKDKEEWEKLQDRMWKVRSYDLRLVDISDFLIVRIVPGVASWGSAEELVTSVRAKKPIFLVVEGSKKNTPLWIFGMIPHRYIYDSIDDALKMITNIDEGITPIDSDRWKLLKKEYRIPPK